MNYHNQDYKNFEYGILDFALFHNLNVAQASYLKYITRAKVKGGTKDLEKAKFFLTGKTEQGVVMHDFIEKRGNAMIFNKDLHKYMKENKLDLWQRDALNYYFLGDIEGCLEAIEYGIVQLNGHVLNEAN